jgi:spore coat protein D
MHCKPSHVLPAVVHPTKCCVNHNFVNNVVPHIHPTHTTTVNHINFQHKHYFPHTQSVVDEVTNQQFFHPPYPAGPAFGPRPRPGAVAGAFMPDYGPGPGFGPGMGPSAVAGAEFFPGAQMPPNWR